MKITCENPRAHTNVLRRFYREAEVVFEVCSNVVPLFVEGQAQVLAVVLLRGRRAVPGLLTQGEVHVFDVLQRGVAALGSAYMWIWRSHAFVHLRAVKAKKHRTSSFLTPNSTQAAK